MADEMERSATPGQGEPTLIVGVGASAGGLEALERLFAGMPARTGMAFVLVQHLSPDYKSLTDELLARRTTIPMRQVEDGMRVEPDAVYLLPPRKEMILSDGRLLLTDKEPSPAVALPIDGFFRSLAREAGSRAVGVVLSGTGSDGSRGVRDIREAGGLVLVQHPDSARFDGMPRSAIASGAVHLTLSPEDMPAALVRHAGRSVPELVHPPDDALQTVVRLLREAQDIDFSAYKPETVSRRVERRVGILRLSGLPEYAARLADDPEELNRLYKDLLIGVTGFFRDPELFARLRTDVLPSLLDRVEPGGEFRAWVAGCATGEEAYSLALILSECVEELGRPIQVRVFASDVHRASLDQAARGVYPAAGMVGVDPARLSRHFVQRGDAFEVSAELRKMVVFARHNVLKDAPFTKLDLVSCRNLLIYFQSVAQAKALSLFHFGLKTGGTLVIGPSENVGELADDYETIDARWKVFRKRRDGRPPVELRTPQRPSVAVTPTTPEAAFLGVLDALLDRHMPAALLVNAKREVVRSFAGANRFLRMPGGWFSSDVLDLVDPELRTALAGALPRVFREASPVVYKGLRVAPPQGERVVDVTVEPVRAARGGATFALIRFDDLGAAPPPLPETHEVAAGEASAEHVLSLESELRSTRENLRAMIEELETSNEELQATNEELVAANEELQSTNEELHSVNEELYTVNGEYQRKIGELTELTADVDNLLTSTEVHTIFLDRDLRIRKFTPKMAETFNLLPQDVGRRIDSFTHSIEYPGLLDDLTAVLRTTAPSERPVRDRNGHWFLLRVLPYWASGGVGGVVLTLVDIDRLRRVEDESRRKEQQLAGILRNSPNWVFMKDMEGRYLLADAAFRELVGCDPIGKTTHDIHPKDVADALVAQDLRVMATGLSDEREVTIPHADGPHAYLSVMFPIRDGDSRVVGLGGVRTDITRLKQAESQAREAVAQRDRFLAMLSHELRNPLAAVINAANVIRSVGVASSESAEWFGVIERRSRHMARLLDDLLDVARITQNKIEVRRETFDLARTVDDVLEEVRSAFAERRLTLSAERPAAPLPVNGDRARLLQVQVNLLMNAAKYTPEGGRVWYTLAEEDGKAVVRIRDDGVGMTPLILERAFDLFVQADETLDRSDGGMGVGLTLVRAIVGLHDGTVEAKSDGPGTGSEFVVRLPLAETLPAPEPAPLVEERREPPGKGLRLLLVDDDADIRGSLHSLLVLDGHAVRAVGDGPSALAAFETEIPDVALLDIGIPGMDGYALARAIRKRWPDTGIRLIALTGYGRPTDREATRAAGFDAHLTKPFDPRDLAALLTR